jgi:hypothetical protein
MASEAAVSRIFSVEDFSNTAGGGLFSILGGFFSSVSELGNLVSNHVPVYSCLFYINSMQHIAVKKINKI